MVDHIFPPAIGEQGHVTSSNALTYSTFTYWREPMADVNLYFEDETKMSVSNNLQKISEEENVKSETETPIADTKNN